VLGHLQQPFHCLLLQLVDQHVPVADPGEERTWRTKHAVESSQWVRALTGRQKATRFRKRPPWQRLQIE
jgi:hypothetical protein